MLIKKIQDYIWHHVAIMGKEVLPESIIKNLSITFDSYSYVMSPKHRIQQPRKVLESKLLKHITKLDVFEKENNYGFLFHIYGLVDHCDGTIYVENNNHICYLINSCKSKRIL